MIPCKVAHFLKDRLLTMLNTLMDISEAETGTQLTWTWTSSCGVEGTPKARGVRFDLQPGKP